MIDEETGEIVGIEMADYGKGEVPYVFLRTPFNYDRDAVSRETGLMCLDETLTQQSFKEECDINTIVRNFGVTGEMPNNVRMPLPPDFQETMDYRESLEMIRQADAAFMQYPAELRARFENNPQKFADFIMDVDNKEEVGKLGLLRLKDPDPSPMLVRVVPESGTGST